jgi:hypothetical protein
MGWEEGQACGRGWRRTGWVRRRSKHLDRGRQGARGGGGPVSFQHGSGARLQNVADAGGYGGTGKGQLPRPHRLRHMVRAPSYRSGRLGVHQ